MRVNVLGATEVWLDGRPVDLGALKPRSVVAALALSGGRAVSPDTLADLVWGEQPPDGVAGTLQAYVSGLRRALEPGRAPRTPPTVLVTVPPGYALRLDDDAIDAVRFAAQVNGVRRRLGRRAHAWDPVASDRARRAHCSPSSTRRWRCGAGSPTSTSARRSRPWPSEPASPSSGWSRWRTARPSAWRSATTARSPRSSRR